MNDFWEQREAEDARFKAHQFVGKHDAAVKQIREMAENRVPLTLEICSVIRALTLCEMAMRSGSDFPTFDGMKVTDWLED